MNRPVLSQALTIALMAVILWFAASRQRAASPQASRPASVESNASRPESAGARPESVVWRMLDASRDGDPARYLECYAGEIEPRLRKGFQEMGSARSRDYLQEAHRQLKGVAVRSLQMSSPSEAQMTVEYVYEDRNEIQHVYVQSVDGLWKIERLDGAERIRTLVPYGAPVER
jgi:hypothetical protein